MYGDIDNSRFSQGMSTERFHHWYGQDLIDQPINGVDSLAGNVSVISYHSSEGGMTYHMAEPVGDNWHRPTSSQPLPNAVRPA